MTIANTTSTLKKARPLVMAKTTTVMARQIPNVPALMVTRKVVSVVPLEAKNIPPVLQEPKLARKDNGELARVSNFQDRRHVTTKTMTVTVKLTISSKQ